MSYEEYYSPLKQDLVPSGFGTAAAAELAAAAHCPAQTASVPMAPPTCKLHCVELAPAKGKTPIAYL
jgi:hypothetical protein